MITDVACFLGQWPFRSLPASGLDGLKAMAQKHGVQYAAVSAFEEVFWEDAFESTRRLADTVARETWLRQFQVINPAFPGWSRDVERGAKKLGIRGIRLVPPYHGYSLASGCVVELAQAAREHGLPVAVHVRLQDERMHWMAKFPPASAQDAAAFLQRAGPLRVALLGLDISEMRLIADAIKNRPDTWVDWSRLRSMLFGMEDLLKLLPAERVLYGSLWPLQTPSAMLNLVRVARIGDDVRKRITQDNGTAFMTP